MVKEKNRRERKEAGQNSTRHRNKLIAFGIVAGIVATIVYASYYLDKTSTSITQVIDGIECNTNEYFAQHIHAHLDFYVNGNHLTVPERIGIVDNKCLYWMHTHDASGVMHIESPKSQEFTLGQFIDIWKATGDFPIYEATPKIFVNGQLVNTSLNETKIKAHDEITLAYGSIPQIIPPAYQFPEGE